MSFAFRGESNIRAGVDQAQTSWSMFQLDYTGYFSQRM